VTTRKLPSTLEEKQLNVEVLKTFDKAFSCVSECESKHANAATQRHQHIHAAVHV